MKSENIVAVLLKESNGIKTIERAISIVEEDLKMKHEKDFNSFKQKYPKDIENRMKEFMDLINNKKNENPLYIDTIINYFTMHPYILFFYRVSSIQTFQCEIDKSVFIILEFN